MKTARRRPGALSVTVAGIGVVGVSFGMARYGYGLLLPDLRAAYGLSTGALGAIAAGAYLAYLVASLAVGPLVTRLGARRVILLGGGCAAAGMLLAGLSQSPTVLAAGVLVGGASCGLVFPPFLDAVQALVAPERRARTFAAISSGTGWGVAIAAPVAIVAGSGWRAAWLTFAVLAVLATLWAARVLPDDRAGTGGRRRRPEGRAAAAARLGRLPALGAAARGRAAGRPRRLGLLDVRGRPPRRGRRAAGRRARGSSSRSWARRACWAASPATCWSGSARAAPTAPRRRCWPSPSRCWRWRPAR